MAAPASLVGAEQLEIRSFRVVFALERRLFRIDRWRLPLPYGVPLRGIAYAMTALLAILAAGAAPGAGMLVGAIPPPIRFVVIPIAVAALLARVRVDGRPAHRFVGAVVRHRLGPRVVDAFAPAAAPGSAHAFTDDVVLADSLAAPTYRPGEVAGPAAVVLAAPAQARPRGRTLELTPTDGAPLRRGKRIALQAGQRLLIREPRS